MGCLQSTHAKKNNQTVEAPNHGPNHHISMMVLGDENSDKTALIQRYCDTFDDKKQTYECRLEKQAYQCEIITLSIKDYSRGSASDKQYECDLRSEDHQVYIICYGAYSPESFRNAKAEYELLMKCKANAKNKWTVMFASTGYNRRRGDILNGFFRSDGLSAETDENVNLLFEQAVANQLGCGVDVDDIKTCVVPKLNRDIDNLNQQGHGHKHKTKLSYTTCRDSNCKFLSCVIQDDVDVDDIDITGWDNGASDEDVPILAQINYSTSLT